MINDEIYQPVWELNQKVRCASNEKILRRQLELLTKYCHRCLDLEKIPEASESMVLVSLEKGKVVYWTPSRSNVTPSRSDVIPSKSNVIPSRSDVIPSESSVGSSRESKSTSKSSKS